MPEGEDPLYFTFIRAAKVAAGFLNSSVIQWGDHSRGVVIPRARQHGVNKPLIAKSQFLKKQDVETLLSHGFFDGREVLVMYFVAETEEEEK